MREGAVEGVHAHDALVRLHAEHDVTPAYTRIWHDACDLPSVIVRPCRRQV